MECIRLQDVNAVGKGAWGGATLLVTKSGADVVCSEVDGWWSGCGGGGPCGWSGGAWEVEAGRVEWEDGSGDEGGGEAGNRQK